MKNIRYIDKKDVENLIESKTSDDVIIFLPAPHRKKHPSGFCRQGMLLLSMVPRNIY